MALTHSCVTKTMQRLDLREQFFCPDQGSKCYVRCLTGVEWVSRCPCVVSVSQIQVLRNQERLKGCETSVFSHLNYSVNTILKRENTLCCLLPRENPDLFSPQRSNSKKLSFAFSSTEKLTEGFLQLSHWQVPVHQRQLLGICTSWNKVVNVGIWLCWHQYKQAS